ncbi:MAG: hypothetical protein WD871_16015 [Xanthobacteraceae bacterium]
MNRREFTFGLLAGAAGFLLAKVLGDSAAFAQSGQRFSAIVVDTKPLEARGASGAAAIIRPQLQASLQREMAGRIGRGGPTLVVRIETVFLAASAIEGGGRRSASYSDYLEGEVIAGQQRFPLFATQSSSMAGAWYAPDNEARRLRALAVQFAGWVSRKV